MAPLTHLTVIQNETDGEIVFHKPDQSGQNRTVPARCSRSVDCWMPQPANAVEFNAMHIELQSSGRIIYYIWERGAPEGWRVRLSNSGWEDPGSPIPGHSESGGPDRVLRIDDSGVLLTDLSLP